jgi:ferrous iron transport protein B
MAIDRHQGTGVELVHYPQPLLREADCWRRRWPHMPQTACWLGLQMLEGDIYSRAYAGDAADKLDVSLARLSDELDDPRCTSPMPAIRPLPPFAMRSVTP